VLVRARARVCERVCTFGRQCACVCERVFVHARVRVCVSVCVRECCDTRRVGGSEDERGLRRGRGFFSCLSLSLPRPSLPVLLTRSSPVPLPSLSRQCGPLTVLQIQRGIPTLECIPDRCDCEPRCLHWQPRAGAEKNSRARGTRRALAASREKKKTKTKQGGEWDVVIHILDGLVFVCVCVHLLVYVCVVGGDKYRCCAV